MAKGKPVDVKLGGRMVTRGLKGKKPEFPPGEAESNATADRQARVLFWLLLLTCALLVAGGLTWSTQTVASAVFNQPIEWLGVFFGLAGVMLSLLLGRTLLWISFLVPMVFASKRKGWESEEQLCRRALKLSRIVPTGASTAAVMLVQNLLSRGKFEEAFALGEEQWEKHHKDAKYSHSLAPLYSAVGLARQARGEFKESAIWNERAIEAFSALLTQLTTRKGLLARLARGHNAQIIASLHTQLSVAYFNNATSQFNQRNHRAAKEQYRRAVEEANQAPDFPEKADLLKAAREQLSRLKHA